MSQDLLLDFDGLDKFVKAQGATTAQFQAALRSTLTKVAKWARTRARRALAQELKVPQRAMGVRTKAVSARASPGGLAAKVWFGLNALSLTHLNPKKSGKGMTTAASGYVAGAFQSKTNKRSPVFRREGPKRTMTKGSSVGRSKQPIVKVQTSILHKSLAYLDHHMLNGPELERQFLLTFQNELNWRMTKP